MKLRMHPIACSCAAVVVCAAAGGVAAQESKVQLTDGPGKDKAGQCVACHSLDYIVANSPFMTRQVWDAEVTKMIKAFGAPISDADAKEIVDYLSANYGAP